jgi:hypothetical protein
MGDKTFAWRTTAMQPLAGRGDIPRRTPNEMLDLVASVAAGSPAGFEMVRREPIASEWSEYQWVTLAWTANRRGAHHDHSTWPARR